MSSSSSAHSSAPFLDRHLLRCTVHEFGDDSSWYMNKNNMIKRPVQVDNGRLKGIDYLS